MHRLMWLRATRWMFWTVVLAAGFGDPSRAQDAEVKTRQVAGVIRFTNQNPAILERLGPPGNEGITSFSLRADSLAPHAGLVTETGSLKGDGLTAAYAMSLQAGTDAASAIAYSVVPSVDLDSDREQLFLHPKETPPLVAGPAPQALDFGECVGLLEVRFVDAQGRPVAVAEVSGSASDGVSTAYVHAVPPDNTGFRWVVPIGQISLRLEVRRGNSVYSDQITQTLLHETAVACDQILEIPFVLAGGGELGRLRGTVDMVGEFEWTTEAVPTLGLLGRTAIFGLGPSGNRRWDFVAGNNVDRPASGAFELENLVPSVAEDAATGWSLWSELHFRAGQRFEYFISPRLGWGLSNAPVQVPPGGTVELVSLFEFRPGVIHGRLLLAGPPDTAGAKSALRGLLRPDALGTDEQGIPKFTGAAGILNSYVVATGVDRPAAGARRTAAGGQAHAAFPGEFRPESAAFEGDYELVVGGLNGEASIWRPDLFRLVLDTTDKPEVPYVNQAFTINETSAPEIEVRPGTRVARDVAYGFSEVCIRFRSADRPFYLPQVTRFSTGRFEGLDFAGQPRRYEVGIDVGYGIPLRREDAGRDGLVTLYLPQGDYVLHPAVIARDEAGDENTTGLEPIRVTVGARQRTCLEECLQVIATVTRCGDGPARLRGSVRTCNQSVTRVAYRLNGGDEVTLCENCGPNPILDAAIPLPPGDAATNRVEIVARDAQGGSAFLHTEVVAAAGPPVIQCPPDLVIPRTSPCGARPTFEVAATGSCDGQAGPLAVTCVPSSDSLFPVGETTVVCTATDAAGRTAECRFKVTVLPTGDFPSPTLGGVGPTEISGAMDVLSIRGTGFTPDDEVHIDGEPLQDALLAGENEIVGHVPWLAPGVHGIEIRRCGEVAARLAEAFTSARKPRIHSVEPGVALASGGNPVTVLGTNFVATTRIRVGFAAEADANLLRNGVVSADGTRITGEVPPLPDGEPLGPRALIAFDERGEDVLALGITYLPVPEPEPEPGDDATASFHELETASTTPVELNSREGRPASVAARVLSPGATPEQRARGFLERFRGLYRQERPAESLSLQRVLDEELTHVTFRQRRGDLAVFGADLVVTLQGEEVIGTSGVILPTEELDNVAAAPLVTAERAAEVVRAMLGLRLPMAALAPDARLEIFAEAVLSDTPNPAPPALVWHVRLANVPDEVLVDAQTGEVRFHLPNRQEHGDRLHLFRLDLESAEFEANSDDDSCFHTSDDSDVGDENGLEGGFRNQAEPQAAWLFARETYAFFHQNFNWHSYDNAGTEIEIFLFSTMPVANAARWVPGTGCDLIEFAPGQMDYEVLVHEFTHAIIHYTSRLIYQNESGALNEHYADIMAVIADRDRGDPESGGVINWRIGENRLNGGGAFRDLSNPRSFGQPELYTNRVFGAQDNGRVHANSGIPNKAAFLMIQGQDYSGIVVRGMGIDRTRQLKWEALRTLPSGATLEMARDHEVNLARAWARTGTHGFGPQDLCTVRNAWAAVGLGRGDFDCNGSEDARWDSDNDGILDHRDNCPRRANTDQRDTDGDGLGDVCDNCASTPNRDQADLDLDRIGDACDPDRDNDGCLNTVDQHPDSAVAVVGIAKNVNCSESTTAYKQSESGDSDKDGTADCADLDDDNDGIPDDRDACPVGSLAGNIGPAGGCTIIGKDCPRIRKDWFLTCTGGGCVEYFVKFTDRSNPNPVRDVVFDRVTMVNNTLFVAPPIGATVAQAASRIQALAGRRLGSTPALAGLQAAAPPSTVRLELWRRPAGNQPARIVGIVSEFDSGQLDVGAVSEGTFLAFTPSLGTNAPALDAVWHIGQTPGQTKVDSDGDGLPDGWERQYGLDPRNPADARVDLDGDGLSSADEYAIGSDPGSRSSRFAVEQLALETAGVRVHFRGPAGRLVRLERSTGIPTSAWQSVGTPVRLHGDTGILTDPTGLATQAFYRLRLVNE